MADKPTYRYSRLSQFELCGYASYLQWVESVRGMGNFFTVRGNGLHAARDTNLRQKIETGEDLLEAELCDSARDEINRQFNDEAIDGKHRMIEGLSKKAAAGYVIDQTLPMVKADRRKFQPQIKPILVEKKISVELESLPFDLSGTVDTVTRDLEIIDAKTAIKRWSQRRADDSYQPPLYTFYVETLLGKKLRGFKFQVLSDGKRGIQIEEIPTVVTAQRLQAVLQRMLAMHAVIEAGAFAPCHKGHWYCSEDWCPFYRNCKYTY